MREVKIDNIRKAVLLVYWVLVCTCVLDFILMTIGINYYSFISSFIPVEAGIIGFPRARGAFPEPTDIGAALTIFYFLSIGVQKLNNKHSVALLISWILCFILHRSGMAIITFGFGHLLLLFLSKGKFQFRNFFNLFSFILLASALFYILDLYFDGAVSTSTFDKIFLKDENKGSGRVEIYADVLNLVLSQYSLTEWMFGKSLGMFSKVHVINYYLQSILEIGIVGLTLIFSFVFYIWLQIRNMNSVVRPYFFAAGLVILFQLFSNTGFYFPHIWMFILTLLWVKKFNFS
jgi:hypothetical protein